MALLSTTVSVVYIMSVKHLTEVNLCLVQNFWLATSIRGEWLVLTAVYRKQRGR